MFYLNKILLIFLGLMFFVQLLTASWYDLIKKTGEEKSALKHKIICSLIYAATFLLCTAIGNSFLKPFTILFAVAITLLFIHDITEEKSSQLNKIVSPILSSMAYIVLAIALYIKNAELFNLILFTPAIRIALTIAVGLLCIIFVVKAPKASPAIAVIFMTISAGMLAFNLQNSGTGIFQATSFAVTLGSIALLASSLIPIFDKTENKSLLRINTYYFGLMFLSCVVAAL